MDNFKVRFCFKVFRKINWYINSYNACMRGKRGKSNTLPEKNYIFSTAGPNPLIFRWLIRSRDVSQGANVEDSDQVFWFNLLYQTHQSAATEHSGIKKGKYECQRRHDMHLQRGQRTYRPKQGDRKRAQQQDKALGALSPVLDFISAIWEGCTSATGACLTSTKQKQHSNTVCNQR